MLKKWIKRLNEETPVNTQPKTAESLPNEQDIKKEAENEPVLAKEMEKTGLFKRLKERMEKTRSGFVRQMDELIMGKREIDPELLDELEELLVTSDMGVSTVQKIFDQLRDQVKRRELFDPQALRERLKEHLIGLLNVPSEPLSWSPTPFVILVVGVNGVGKTTTIAKLAYKLKKEGKNVLLVAADTFRAAAIEQLESWAGKVGCSIIKHQSGSDPSAVAFDGIQAGLRRNVDAIIIDTAGRLHTKTNLMEELKKIKRVIGKKIPEAPHEVLLVLDATTGQNALNQARLFKEAAGVTGIALTKLDGTAKGGIVVSIVHQMQIPIRFIGIGEKMDDLRLFEPEEFIKAIFEGGP